MNVSMESVFKTQVAELFEDECDFLNVRFPKMNRVSTSGSKIQPIGIIPR